MLGAAALFRTRSSSSGNTRNRVVAANLATEQMENVRGHGRGSDPVRQHPAGLQTIVHAIAANNATGERHPVHRAPERAVRRRRTRRTSTCDSPATSSTGQILQVSRDGYLAGDGRDASPSTRSRTSRRPWVSTTSAVGFDRGEGLRLDRRGLREHQRPDHRAGHPVTSRRPPRAAPTSPSSRPVRTP